MRQKNSRLTEAWLATLLATLLQTAADSNPTSMDDLDIGPTSTTLNSLGIVKAFMLSY
jgi:hypothetical protein